ncbi:hypothetical protein [Streptosporangium sp. NPDC023615]|uniref:hypothetical protein n=1 Tax=Streptosporangium sp. NPDC023615 TaxID=3154794 RepID=UPI00341F6FAC
MRDEVWCDGRMGEISFTGTGSGALRGGTEKKNRIGRIPESGGTRFDRPLKRFSIDLKHFGGD